MNNGMTTYLGTPDGYADEPRRLPENDTFRVPLLVYGPGLYIEWVDVNVRRMIRDSGGNLVRYIQDYEDVPYEWAFADQDDLDDYDY